MINLRNIAIIAHVDHGKSTLVDALLKQSGADLGKAGKEAGDNLIMDFNELERERGITIFSKNASVRYKDFKINIIDTPGHADFSGEVERVLNMADGSLLLVDAQEGPMPQTRFVLKKALEMGHKIIVVINKVDKKNARVNYALERMIELFIELGVTNEQLDFPIIYSAGKLGKAGTSPELEKMENMDPLFEAIIKHIPSPSETKLKDGRPQADPEKPLQMMVVSIDYDNYKGRVGIGRIYQGKIKDGETVAHIKFDAKVGEGTSGVKNSKITALLTFEGLKRVPAEEVLAGDIAAVAGLDDIMIGDTIASLENPVQLPPILIEKPTVKMIFSVNNSPFSGREGQYSTSRNLKERLEKELDNDVALKVLAGDSPDEFIVAGRGELHLAILIEKMRREGYELQVSRPEVIFSAKGGSASGGKEEKIEILEPFEEVWIEVKEQYQGLVIEKMSRRKGEMKNMASQSGIVSFHFLIPTRGLIGFRNEFLIETKGTGLINSLFHGYLPKCEGIEASPHGSLIAHEAGESTAYALLKTQERGEMFIGPGEHVYEGQVVGETAKADDLVVNVCKQKQLTNFRAKTNAVTDDLVPPRRLTLEQAIEYIGDDELVEVTPKSIRLRKRILKNVLRKKDS